MSAAKPHERTTSPREVSANGRQVAALRFFEQYGEHIKRTARRYAATSEDADDAFQRGIEILLRKAPELPEDELVPWLKTVVKHEAFALRRQRERLPLYGHGADEADASQTPLACANPVAPPDEQ